LGVGREEIEGALQGVKRRVGERAAQGGLLSLAGAVIAPRRLPRIDPRIDPTPAEPAAAPHRDEPLGRRRAERAGKARSWFPHHLLAAALHRLARSRPGTGLTVDGSL
jgi:hypothetical protein